MDNTIQEKSHPLHKSHMFISSKHVDFDNLSAVEGVALSLALVLSVTAASMYSYLNLI